MITIRPLQEVDMLQAMELKVLCWTEELAEKAENILSVSEELDYWVDWMNTAQEHSDIRLLIGAFENENLLGAAFGSIAETEDIAERGIELNGLWVHPEQRGRGISLKMILYILEYFLKNGMEQIVIYNHHFSPSNSFYHKFGAQVGRQEYQMDGRLLVDVFKTNIAQFKENIEQSLKKYGEEYRVV